MEASSWKALFLILATAFIAGACGAGGGGGDQGGDGGGGLSGLELNLGTVLPLTGDLAQFGPGMENGAKLAVKHINACDTLTVNATYEDSGTNEQTAATAADKLINTDDVSVIVGAASSRVSFAVVDTAAQNSVVQISPASTSPDFTDYEDNGYFFRTTPSDALQGVVLADLAQNEGYGTVNVIALNDDYGQGIASTFEENFEGNVEANVAYDPQGTNFSSEVQRVSRGNPDAILVVAFPETGTIILQAAIEQGIVGETPLLFTDGMADPGVVESISRVEGERGTRPAAEGPGTESFNSAFDKEFGEVPGTFSANTYDAVMVATLAAAAAGSTEGPDIQANLTDASKGGTEVLPENICEGLRMAANGEDVNYEGAAGSQNMDDNGDVTSDYELWEFKDGRVARVEVIPAPTVS